MLEEGRLESGGNISFSGVNEETLLENKMALRIVTERKEKYTITTIDSMKKQLIIKRYQ